MSKMNGKKEMLKKKEATREIKDNEIENVSGGYISVGGQYVTAGYIDKGKNKGQAWAVANTREGIEKEEKKLKNQGFNIIM